MANHLGALLATAQVPGQILFNVKDYGALGGFHDDTIAIQAAITAAAAVTGVQATVYFPADSYNVSATLISANLGAGIFNGINILGDGPFGTHLRWAGTGSGANARLFQFYNSKMFRATGVHFLNIVGSTGDTIGLDFNGSQNGTTIGSGIIDNCIFESFNVGCQLGQVSTAKAASELLFICPQLVTCDVGISAYGANTLDITLVLPQFSACGKGFNANVATSIQSYGGGASGSTIADFVLASAGAGASLISGFRSENGNRFVIATSSGTLHLDSCNVSNIVASDHIAVETHDGTYIISGGIYRGFITATAAPSFSIKGAWIRGPGIITPVSIGDLNGVQLDSSGNVELNSSGVAIDYFPHQIGAYNASDVFVSAY